MALTTLRINSGVVTDITRTGAKGDWVDTDKVRFRLGYPEKIGGWRSYNRNRYVGECCELHRWDSLTDDRYMGVATNLKLYIESSGSLSDVTPIRTTNTLANNPFTTVGGGSSFIMVSGPNHGAVVNDFVTFSGALGNVSVSGTQINSEFRVVFVPDANSYTIDIGFAIAPITTFGGAAVVAEYQVNTGITSQILGSGWGSGGWGRGGWGSGYYNSTSLFRVWSFDNFGEELLAAANYGPIYTWRPANGLTTRAVAISSLPGANLTPLAINLLMITDERHVVALGSNDWNTISYDPLLVRWSNQQDYLNWEPTTVTTAGSYRLQVGSTLVAGVKSKGENLVWTDKGLYSMQFVGPPYTFGFSLISDGLSIMGPRAAANARNSIYWMDANQFFLYNGAVLPIECPVREHVFGDFNFGQRYKVFAQTNSAYNEVWWEYPSAASSTCDKYVSYNFLTGEWMIGTLNRTAGIDLALDGKPVMANGGNLYQHEWGVDDDGSPLPFYAESGDLSIADGEQFMFLRRIIQDQEFFKCPNPSIRYMVKQRDFPSGDLITRIDRTVHAPIEQIHTRVRGRQIVLRVEGDGLGTTWRLGATRLDMQPDGQR